MAIRSEIAAEHRPRDHTAIYPRVPTLLGICGLAAASILGCLIVVLAINLEIHDISRASALRINDFGLLIVFCGAVFGGIGLHWDQRVAHNNAVATTGLEFAERFVAEHEEMRERLGLPFEEQISTARERANRFSEELEKTRNYPRASRAAGLVGLMMILAGTILQMMAAGASF